jgi:DnaJ homolog subfamily C member 28
MTVPFPSIKLPWQPTNQTMDDENKKQPPKKADNNRELPRIPPLHRWDTVMDEVIEEAMRNGEFDNLPGRGKPLNLSKNHFAKESELAYGLLKNNDYTLPWIAQRREILEQIAGFREGLRQMWVDYSAEYRVNQDELAGRALEAGWRHYLNNEVEASIQRLNKKIADVNLKQPREVVEILKLTLKKELERAGAAETLEGEPDGR